MLSNVSLTYGALFLGLCLAAHLVLRFTLPYADPYLFPLFAVLACFGLVMIYRIDDELAREQAQWFVIGLALFAATIILLRDYRVLERYRYTIAAVGHRPAAAAAPARDRPAGQRRLPAASSSARSPSSRPSSPRSRSSSSWPATCATRASCWSSARGAFAGITIPPLKHFGPLLVVWGAAMVMLFFIQDLGSSLMFFGGFLAVLYVATNRSRSWSSASRCSPRARGSLYHAAPDHHRTASTPGCTRSTRLYDQVGRQLPDRAVGLRPGRRRALRAGLRRRRCSTGRRTRRCCPRRRPTSSTR